jgi:hypothetical protein
MKEAAGCEGDGGCGARLAGSETVSGRSGTSPRLSALGACAPGFEPLKKSSFAGRKCCAQSYVKRQFVTACRPPPTGCPDGVKLKPWCNLYSITMNRAAIIVLFRVMDRRQPVANAGRVLGLSSARTPPSRT